MIKIIGWVERDKVPGWATREPTVLPPKTLPVLPVSAASAPLMSDAKKPIKAKAKAKVKAKTSDPNDNIDDILDGDPIPYA